MLMVGVVYHLLEAVRTDLLQVGKVSRPYDLLWPVAKRLKPTVETVAKVVEDMGRLGKAPVIASISRKRLVFPLHVILF